MSDKIKFSIEPERTGTGVLKVGNLEPRDYTQNEDILSKADRFDSTNVSGRLRLNDTNFYNYRKYYMMKKREMDEQKNFENDDMLSFAYAHQIQAVETVLKLPSGGLLADQVGMGKTIEAGMLIAELAYRDEWRVLVITLSNDDLIRNWHDEMYEKFGLNLAILKGKDENDVKPVFEALRDYQKSGICKDMNGNTKETIGTVDLSYKGVLIPFGYLIHPEFLKMVDDYNAKNPEHPFHVDMIVVDESHRYTSKQSITAKEGDSSMDNPIQALHKLQMKQKVIFNGEEREQKLGRILLLTATPIKNDLNELLTLMQIIDPKYNKEDFRKELGLKPNQPFDLTSVLSNPRGVNRWWEWFSKFGERHTRITTMYDPNTRRYGVRWKKKNSHSFYFNDDTRYEARPYFDATGVANNKIQSVYGNPIDRENMDSKLKGERTSVIRHYKEEIPDVNMDKFRRILSVVSYFKHEITLDELLEVPFDLKIDGIDKESLQKILSKKDFNDWRAISWGTVEDPLDILNPNHPEAYGDLGNEPEDIEKEKTVEAAVAKFLENLTFQIEGDNSKFFDKFFNFVNGKIPKQQKDKNGISKVKSFSKLAMILCSEDIFLALEKMLELGNIINDPKNANEKVIIFCKDDAERRMLVENAHLWDFTGRYMDNDSVSRIAKLSKMDINYSRFVNVVSIAYTTDAEGLNLQSYHTMVNYSIVLSPLHMEQRIGRIDRIGQKNDMNIYFLANAQNVEGYVLRFFEYELELFSNWSGDTTASTYVDDGDRTVDFDEYSVAVWNNYMANRSMALEDKVRSFEENIARMFNNVRERVINIARYSKDIEDMKIVAEEVDQDELGEFFF